MNPVELVNKDIKAFYAQIASMDTAAQAPFNVKNALI